LREKLGEFLAEKVMYVAEAMNRHEYVPKMPNQSELFIDFISIW
jgi:autophagy-related protein 101